MTLSERDLRHLRKFSVTIWRRPAWVGKLTNKDVEPLVEQGFLERRDNPDHVSTGRKSGRAAFEYRLTHKGFVLAEANVISQIFTG